jgi:hypothetical protein
MVNPDKVYYNESSDFVDQAVIRINTDRYGSIDINITSDQLMDISELINENISEFETKLQQIADNRYVGP